jgi:hypothetical protein
VAHHSEIIHGVVWDSLAVPEIVAELATQIVLCPVLRKSSSGSSQIVPNRAIYEAVLELVLWLAGHLVVRAIGRRVGWHGGWKLRAIVMTVGRAAGREVGLRK